MTDNERSGGPYRLLTPHVVLAAVEESYELRLNGVLTPYSSYVNRVYGLGAEDGSEYIAKFYRPGRWSSDAILEEHQFVADCARVEVPVVPPIVGAEEATLQEVTAVEDEREIDFDFALFPKRGGRSFDAERDEDWLRLGRLVGRIHNAGVVREAQHRLECTPRRSTALFVEELERASVVHPDCSDEFFGIVETGLELITPLFDGVTMHRIHGDCHRGNILDRLDEGLLVIDFDDMMVGPAVQDLWLLLPDRASESMRELNLVLEGYEEFRPFDWSSLRLIEPLRLMRMIYYLAWSARQRDDKRFRESYPQWGSEAFWLKEIEDLRTQVEAIRDEA